MDKDSVILDPLAESIRLAAETLWGKQINAAVSDCISLDKKCRLIMQQLIEGWPAPAAITFAMAYGWMLKEQVEKQGMTRLLT